MIYNLNINSRFGSYGSQGNSIDDTGRIAVAAFPWYYGYLYSGGTDGTSTTLGFGSNSGANGATCFNGNGDVLGFAENAANTYETAFLYSGGTMYDLGGLGYNRGCGVIGANNNGYAVGFASYAGVGSPRRFP